MNEFIVINEGNIQKCIHIYKRPPDTKGLLLRRMSLVSMKKIFRNVFIQTLCTIWFQLLNLKKYHYSMDVFHVILVLKMVPNHAKHQIYSYVYTHVENIAFLFSVLHTISIRHNCFKCFLGTRFIWSVYYQLMI